MIEFNLLPNVKLDYVKTQRTKRLVIFVSQLAIVASLVILAFFCIFVYIVQKKNIHDLNSQITSTTATLQKTPHLNQILTIQNQLKSLPDLEAKTPVTSRLLSYVTQLTPSKVTISDLKVDFTQNTFNITGDADSLATINQFVDTLKFTTYSITNDSSGSSGTAAFSNVQLSGFTKTTKGNNYTIQLSYDPVIFKASNTVALTVPKIITTRSELNNPGDIFQQSPTTSTSTNQ